MGAEKSRVVRVDIPGVAFMRFLAGGLCGTDAAGLSRRERPGAILAKQSAESDIGSAPGRHRVGIGPVLDMVHSRPFTFPIPILKPGASEDARPCSLRFAPLNRNSEVEMEQPRMDTDEQG